MDEKQWGIYIFEDGTNLDECENWGPGAIISMPSDIRVIELRPGHPARVISFDGIIEEPGAEAAVESAPKWMLTEEGLKRV